MAPAPGDQLLLAHRLDAFAGAYSFLSRAMLAAPDDAFVARLREPGLLDEWPLDDDDATTRGRRLLVLSSGGADAPAEDLAALVRDYADLFVGPGPLLAPPYESVHLTTDRLLFDAPTLEVRASYRAFALQAPRLNREPDDHLGLELSFLAELCVRAMDALERGDEFALDTSLAAQQAFLTDHLLRWGATCLDLVAAHATTDFYRGIAALGQGALDQARECFVGEQVQ